MGDVVSWGAVAAVLTLIGFVWKARSRVADIETKVVVVETKLAALNTQVNNGMNDSLAKLETTFTAGIKEVRNDIAELRKETSEKVIGAHQRVDVLAKEVGQLQGQLMKD